MFPLKKIICPIDFSDPSYQALNIAVELAERFEAELILINVVALVPMAPTPLVSGFNVPIYQEELIASNKKTLEDLAENRIPKGINARPVVIRGNPADEIVKVAEKENAGLIVIATHGASVLRRFVFGSVTEKVIRLAELPVLTIPATDFGEEIPHEVHIENTDRGAA
jgi:nucleotide-binding universal stress UspA family protein